MAFDIYEWGLRAYLKVKTRRRGEKVGSDRFGNLYYLDRKPDLWNRKRRWVVYKGDSEASTVPPEWHGWLHFQTDALPTEAGDHRQSWQKEHVPNLTGTAGAYLPPGSTLRGEQRPRATGDYEPWTPS